MPDNKLDNIELRSEEVQEILTRVPHWMIRWGNVLFLALILLILAISWFVKYPDIIPAEAIITTEIPPQKEYAFSTGNFEAILIEDNQIVNRNQVLAVLENTANFRDVYALKSVLDGIQVNNRSFVYPLDSLPLLFLGDIEAQFALFENTYIQYKLNKELDPYANEDLANRVSIAELNRRLSSLESQRDINKTELEFARQNLKRQKNLFEKGVISAQDYENTQMQFAQTQRNYQNFETSISQIREAISNAKSTSKGAEINRIKEEMTLLKNVIQSLNQLKKAIIDWERLYVLKSNIDGRVSFLNYWNTNQTVNQGDLVFTIIPDANSAFIAKLKTPGQNSGKIKIGQEVNLNLENYPEAEFGVLKGQVSRISVLPDEEGFYMVDVELPETLRTSYNKEIVFKQEMRAAAEIITEDLRLVERFFYQFRELMSR
jgi:multidrug resistance efflux pump